MSDLTPILQVIAVSQQCPAWTSRGTSANDTTTSFVTSERLITKDERCLHHFEEASRTVEQPNGGVAKYVEYQMTRDGFVLLVMGLLPASRQWD